MNELLYGDNDDPKHKIKIKINATHVTHTHLPAAGDELTSFTAKRNWMAHTSKQHKFNESERAHRASVTSNTMAYSSTLAVPNRCCWTLWYCFVPGEIFNRNINDNKASRSETAIEEKKIINLNNPIGLDCMKLDGKANFLFT